MHFLARLLAIRLLPAVLIVCLVACGGHSNPTTPPQHLYVGNDKASGQILQYALPITSTSTPTLTVTTTAGTVNVVALALDSAGNLASGDNAGHLAIFSAPITSSSTASAAFNNGSATNDGQLVFNNTGDLFVPTVSTKVNLFNHPLSSASTVSQAITDASLSSAIGAALDSGGNLIVSSTGGSGGNLAVFGPPYTGAPTVTPAVAGTAYRKVALNSAQVFVCSVDTGTGRIDVYNLPLTAASAPAFSMTNVNIPEAVTFDSSGNLYVGNLGDATIRVFTPPFAASSAPSVTLTVGAPASFAVFGIAIGK
jgi:hypothetical protein